MVIEPHRLWPVVEHEALPWQRILLRYAAPLTLIGPAAHYGAALLFDAGVQSRAPMTSVSAIAGALTIYAMTPIITGLMAIIIAVCARFCGGIFSVARGFTAASYGATPVWLAGLVLLAPLVRFPLLSVIVFLAVMHSFYVFYLGLQTVMKVPSSEATQCTAFVMIATVFASAAVGWIGASLGLLLVHAA